ncbi:hypothetical protein [Stenomitos frigidus]|uniref:Uncharacterized protein n=1 Tax=Stenomitos frigidus ULC18 TaxID=2107698 RepID=A0A2T1DYG6_9CYAN|nr:hypothetical protein [Stenomitos frigidus]PSB25522.1 hypothetical protein C7B82_23155 [Stenomitos frigidus ULC18]
MTDSNTLFLQTASAVMNELDIRYMEADLDGKMQLKDDLDKAMMTFSEIRCRLLESEVICTPEDVAQMQHLRQEVNKAGTVQSVLSTMVRLTRFFARL